MMSENEATDTHLDENVEPTNVFCLFILTLKYPRPENLFSGSKMCIFIESWVKFENDVQTRQIVHFFICL